VAKLEKKGPTEVLRLTDLAEYHRFYSDGELALRAFLAR